MGSNPCMEFFEENEGNSQKVKALIEIGQGDQWASLSASSHSPGPVGVDEFVARQVLHPVHWDDELSQVKLSVFDDLSNKGLSVSRLAHTSEETLLVAARARAATRERTFIGLLHLGVGELISLMRSVEGGSGAVFDTALEQEPSHADVCQTLGDRGVARQIRQTLFERYKTTMRRVA